ncbi:MAG: phosphatidate cytidylyltransferase [Ignavibacteriales bacterium]|nr:phosphatidate cytidylyltransferase [Ignavibacteriales bacterium]
MSNHYQRLLVAFIGIPLIVILCMMGGIYFFLFIAMLSVLALHEFYKLTEKKNIKPSIPLGIIAGFILNLSFYYVPVRETIVGFATSVGVGIPYPTQTQLVFMIILIFVFVILIYELFRNRGSVLLNASATIFGVLYISLFLGTVIGLRELFVPLDFPMSRYFNSLTSFTDPQTAAIVYRWGGYTVIAILATIWICDSAAYYVGSAFGKHKLFPRVSPNKSWEGAIGGFIFSILAAIIAKYIALEYLSVANAIVIGMIVGVFGQLGDLFESALKRDAGVKDSSTLLPGHGGVLDRFDSLLFAAPLVYFYLDYIAFS